MTPWPSDAYRERLEAAGLSPIQIAYQRIIEIEKHYAELVGLGVPR